MGGTKLSAALTCLDETGIAMCSSSVFSNEHADECHLDKEDESDDNNTTARTLETEESEETVDMLVNETSKALSASRRGLIYGKCPSPVKTPLTFFRYPSDIAYKNVVHCVRAVKPKPGKGGKATRPGFWKQNGAWKQEQETKQTYDFLLDIGWFLVGTDCKKKKYRLKLLWGYYKDIEKEYDCKRAAFAMYIQLQLCKDLLWVFGIPKPLYAEMCIGGRVDFEFRSRCPQIKGMIITGKAKFTLEVGLDFWVCRISFASLEIGIEVGIDWFKIEIKCWWCHSDGWRRRRRWWR